LGDVQGNALNPGLKRRRGQDVVEAHGQGHPFPGGEEGFQIEDAQFVKGRVLDL